MSGNLGPKELLLLGQGQVGSNDVQAFNDLVACNLDLIDKEVGAILVHGQVVIGGYQDGHQDFKDVLKRGASL